MMQTLKEKRPLGVKVAIAALILLAITSIGGGKVLLDDPSGESMGIQFIAPHLPFNLHDFLLVGIWLIAVFGVLSVILSVGLLARKNWARIATLGLGIVVVTWILSEVYMFYSFGFVFFYPLIGGIGVLEIITMALPSTRQYFQRVKQ